MRLFHGVPLFDESDGGLAPDFWAGLGLLLGPHIDERIAVHILLPRLNGLYLLVLPFFGALEDLLDVVLVLALGVALCAFFEQFYLLHKIINLLFRATALRTSHFHSQSCTNRQKAYIRKGYQLSCVVDFGRRPFPDHLYPLLLIRTHAFALPVNFGLIGGRRRPQLYNLLLVGPQVREAGIAAKAVLDSLLLGVFFLDVLKTGIGLEDGSICPRSRYFGLSPSVEFLFLAMLLNPKMPIVLAPVQLLH